MTIAIVDDNPQDGDLLVSLLSQYQERRSLCLRICRYTGGEQFLAAASVSDCQLVFMDIYMERTDGIETARQFHRINPEALIVFFTTSREDIWRAVALHECFDYIDKSTLHYQKIATILDDATKKLRCQAKVLEFYHGKQKIRLPLARTACLIAQDKYTCVTFADGQEARYRVTFSSLLSMLETDARFLLCNRGVLLNMDYIKKAGRDVFVMMDGQSFPIRKNDRAQIIRTFNDYQFVKLNRQETP